MPRILDFKEMDGAVWAKLDLAKEQPPVHLYTDAEFRAEQHKATRGALRECLAIANESPSGMATYEAILSLLETSK